MHLPTITSFASPSKPGDRKIMSILSMRRLRPGEVIRTIRSRAQHTPRTADSKPNPLLPVPAPASATAAGSLVVAPRLLQRPQGLGFLWLLPSFSPPPRYQLGLRPQTQTSGPIRSSTAWSLPGYPNSSPFLCFLLNTFSHVVPLSNPQTLCFYLPQGSYCYFYFAL